MLEKLTVLSNIIEADVRDTARQNGFALIRPDDFDFDQALWSAFEELRRVSRAMPCDSYGGGAGRMRLYARALRHPDLPTPGRLLFQRPRRHGFDGQFGIEFWQPPEKNPEHGGLRRVFEPIPETLHANSALLRIVEVSLRCALFDEDALAEPMQVGMHIVRLEPGADAEAVASPDCIHTDGEPFTFVTLLDRENVEGGENVITETAFEHRQPHEVPPASVRGRFTLTRPLETYMVVDEAVAHYVAPVRRLDPSRAGWRSVLIVDFTPLRPALVGLGGATRA